MKPALSVIFFTTASGAGYGMLFWLGILNAAGVMPQATWFGPIAVGVAMALASAGLMASTFHLGRPERAWRAISQWRTSWLSREGVVSLLTYVPAAAFFVAWPVAGAGAPVVRVLGLLAAVFCAATVICTAMIYASLKPVRQWRNRFVVPNYLLLAAFSGAACLAATAIFWTPGPARIAAAIAVVSAVAAAVGKFAYWRFIDAAPPVATIESATGLGSLGPVRMLEAPNSEENYLLREMGFRIGRKHAPTLRAVTMVLGFALPAILLILGAVVVGTAALVLLPCAALFALLGLYVERWLFFAQATHTVTLYYGRGG